MKKTILAIAAILATAGLAAADDTSSRFVYGDAAPQMGAPVASASLGYATAAFAIMPTGQAGGDWNDRYGDRAPSSIVVNPPSTIDYSAAASIGAAGQRHMFGASLHILGGSN